MLKVSSQRLWIGDWIFLKLSQVSLISDWINWKVSQGSWIGDWIILNVSQRSWIGDWIFLKLSQISWIGDWIFLKLSQISWISDWIFLKLSQRSWIGDWIILKVQQRSEIGDYQNVILDVEIQVYVDLWRRDVHVWCVACLRLRVTMSTGHHLAIITSNHVLSQRWSINQNHPSHWWHDTRPVDIRAVSLLLLETICLK